MTEQRNTKIGRIREVIPDLVTWVQAQRADSRSWQWIADRVYERTQIRISSNRLYMLFDPTQRAYRDNIWHAAPKATSADQPARVEFVPNPFAANPFA